MRWIRGSVALLLAAGICVALPGTTRAQDHEPVETDDVRITVIYDNTVYDGAQGVSEDWGFSALIETGEQRVLFDTGANGARLLANMKALAIDPTTIDVIVISHDHADHTGGLAALLTSGKATPERIVVLPSTPEELKTQMSTVAEVVEGEPGMVIAPGIVSTGELTTSPYPEQALLIDVADGMIVLTGCAHPGIVTIVQAAQALSDAPVVMAMGGFHLLELNAAQVQRIITDLRDLGVQQAAPSHCTGPDAIQAFADNFGEDYGALGAGRVLEFPAPVDPVES